MVAKVFPCISSDSDSPTDENDENVCVRALGSDLDRCK